MAILKKVLIIANLKKRKVRPILKDLQALLKSKNIISAVSNPIFFKLRNNNLLTDLDPGFKYTDYDLIIALGGTALSCSRPGLSIPSACLYWASMPGG